MAAIIQIRGGTAAQWTSVNPILADRELGLETDTGQIKIGDGVTTWSLLTYIYAIATSPNASETQKGFAEESTAAELLAGTATGGTGAKLFITPEKLLGYRSLTQIASSVAGSTLNLNFSTQVEALFNVATTLAANCTLTVTETNGRLFVLQFAVTGTVVITMPSTFVFETGEVSLGRWNSSTKLLTLTGATNTEYEIMGLKRGSVWRCISSKYV